MGDFLPNLTPKEVIQYGSFGGIYFYDEEGTININYKEFPSDWFEGLDESQFKSKKYNKKVNYFKIKSGLSQEEWEEKGWINSQDPRGWFQWYCRYFLGGEQMTTKGRFRDGLIFVERKGDGETIFTRRYSIKELQLKTYHSRLQ